MQALRVLPFADMRRTFLMPWFQMFFECIYDITVTGWFFFFVEWWEIRTETTHLGVGMQKSSNRIWLHKLSETNWKFVRGTFHKRIFGFWCENWGQFMSWKICNFSMFMEHCRVHKSGKANSKLVFLLLQQQWLQLKSFKDEPILPKDITFSVAL